MPRFHWPHYTGQTFSIRATNEQAADWITAARSAGFKHPAKWIAEAADFYSTFQKREIERARRREEKEHARIAERVRRVAAGLDPDTGEAR